MEPRVLMALLALGLDGLFGGTQPRAEEVCHHEMSTAISRLDDAMVQHDEIANPKRAQTAVLEAVGLFRRDRRQDALRKLDAAIELLTGAWGRTIDADRRSAATAAIREARSCVETRRPPALATLVVRTFLLDTAASRGVGAPAGAGVLVFVGETRVGQTGADGVATVRVPPGRIEVLAQKPLAAGEVSVTLPPGGSGAVSIVLSPDRHDLQTTDLVLVEAGFRRPTASRSWGVLAGAVQPNGLVSPKYGAGSMPAAAPPQEARPSHRRVGSRAYGLLLRPRA